MNETNHLLQELMSKVESLEAALTSVDDTLQCLKSDIAKALIPLPLAPGARVRWLGLQGTVTGIAREPMEGDDVRVTKITEVVVNFDDTDVAKVFTGADLAQLLAVNHIPLTQTEG